MRAIWLKWINIIMKTQGPRCVRTTKIELLGRAYAFLECHQDAPLVFVDHRMINLTPICDAHGIDYDLNKWTDEDKVMIALALP